MLQFVDFFVYCGNSLLNLKLTLKEMMMKKLLILIFLIIFSATTNAQNPLLKRLQKKIENRLENKVESKVMQKTDQSVDKVLEGQFESLAKPSSKISAEALPAKYSFSYEYETEIQSQNNKPVSMTYFLQPNASYQGMAVGDIKSDMFMVMDFDKELMVSFMNMSGTKMAQTISFANTNDSAEEAALSDYQTSALPDLIIAGYNCKGLQLKNKDYLIKYYFTNEVPVSLNGMGRDKKSAAFNKIINGISTKDPGLMMKMDLTDLKNKKNNMVMLCKSLKKTTKEISKNDYKFM